MKQYFVLLTVALCFWQCSAEGLEPISLRHLLETELTVANDNNTYPNATINVGIARPEGCVAWWNKIGAGQTPCPKDCQLSGFKEGYNLGQTGPLYVRVEKGQTSRIAPRPLQGAFLNITGNSRIDNRADYKYQVSDYGVDFVQFSAIKNFGARFTVYMGLVKKDPNAGGALVADPNAKHTPYCYFNVTWEVVPVGTVPAAAPSLAAAAKKPAAAAADATEDPVEVPAPAPALAPAKAAAKKPAAAASDATSVTPDLAPAPAPVAAAKKPAAAAPTLAAAMGKKPAAPAPAPTDTTLSSLEDLGL